MVELSRRGFLGGMLSILAVAAVPTFIPSPAEGNWMPRIYGNGKDHDGEGLQALFDGQDVILPADKIGLRGGRIKGVEFHKGHFVIDRELFPEAVEIIIDGPVTFDGALLRSHEAFFTLHQGNIDKIARDPNISWLRSEGFWSIDIGGRQYGTNRRRVSDTQRTPRKRQALAEGLGKEI